MVDRAGDDDEYAGVTDEELREDLAGTAETLAALVRMDGEIPVPMSQFLIAVEAIVEKLRVLQHRRESGEG